MEREINEFITYLHEEKKATSNTEVSYRRDLHKLQEFLQNQGIWKVEDISITILNSHVLNLEKKGFAMATISRNVASIKSFMQYLMMRKKIDMISLERIKAPKVEKKVPDILSVDEMARLLIQPNLQTDKGVRDRAMLEILYATGIRVSELINLKLLDVNLKIGFVTCSDSTKVRNIPIGKKAAQALSNYIDQSRNKMCANTPNSKLLFFNCSGKPMSRQGFWKLIKGYAKKADIESDITPHTIRHSFAAHLIGNGADLKVVQEMLGHADIATTQVYVNMNQSKVRDVYYQTHPRG